MYDLLKVCGVSENFCDWFYADVFKKFKISDYSDLTWLLGMKIESNSSEMKISQEKFIEKILQKLLKWTTVRLLVRHQRKIANYQKNDCPQEGSEEQIRIRKTNILFI